MNFGQALEILKQGKRVHRSGWNGRGMWIQIKRDGFRELARPYLEMYDAQGMYVPWLASQTDILAEDWEAIP